MNQKLRLFRNNIGFAGFGVFLLDIVLQYYFRLINFGVPNFGISFGVFEGLGRSIGLVVFVVFFGWILQEMIFKNMVNVELVLVAFGGLGNAVSRVIIGNVWDYIYLPFLPFWFNLSDVLISIGIVSYILGSNGDSSSV